MSLNPLPPEARPGFQRRRKSSVNQAVVKKGVDRTIGRNPEASGRGPGVALIAPPQQAHCGEGEDHNEKVVQLEESLAGFMVAAMQNPERAVHHIAMRYPGKRLHPCERAHEDQP